MSGYELTVILEEGGIKVGQISADVDEFRVVADVALSGAPTTATTPVSAVSGASRTICRSTSSSSAPCMTRSSMA